MLCVADTALVILFRNLFPLNPFSFRIFGDKVRGVCVG